MPRGRKAKPKLEVPLSGTSPEIPKESKKIITLVVVKCTEHGAPAIGTTRTFTGENVEEQAKEWGKRFNAVEKS